MKCIVCERPTFMTYKKGEVEAAFCHEHVPKDISITRINICVMCRT